MSGFTSRTRSFLLTTEFQDGQAAGSITPSDMRDFIGSATFSNVTGWTFRPDLPPYSIDFTGNAGAAAANVTAFLQLFADVTTAGGGTIEMPAGTCYLTGGGLTGFTYPSSCKLKGAGPNATLLQRTGSGVLLSASGANAATPAQFCVFEDFGLVGTLASGALLQIVYGNGHVFNRVYANFNNDAGFQIVQLWDSAFYSCRVITCGANTSATAFTSGDEGGGTTIGSEAIQILSAIAGSSFGSSTDSSNQVRFYNTAIINFSAGAITITSTSFNSVGAHQISFVDTHIETNTFSGKYLVAESGATNNAKFVRTYLYVDSSNNAHGSANVGTMQMFYQSANAGNHIEGLAYGTQTASLFQSVVKCFGSFGSLVRDLNDQGNQAMLNGVLWVAGGSLPTWANITSSNTTTIVYPTAYAPAYGTPESPKLQFNVRGVSSYTLALTDVEVEVQMSSGSANTPIFPTNASVAFAIGATGFIRRTGAGTMTLTAAGGVTLNVVTATPAQWARVTWVKTATNTFDVS